MGTYTIKVIGLVEREVTVEAENIDAAMDDAEIEWAALTGGIVQSAEIVIAVQEEA